MVDVEGACSLHDVIAKAREQLMGWYKQTQTWQLLPVYNARATLVGQVGGAGSLAMLLARELNQSTQ